MSQIKSTAGAPIGIFDSGMGGLTVLAALRAALPGEDFIYLGDTARLPYGTKTPATVQRYALQATAALAARQVKAVVVACNTASGLALDEVAQHHAPLPVYGVVLPGASEAAAVADATGVLVLATESTVKGGAYQRALLAANGRLKIHAHACPLWVTLAETGSQSNALVDTILRHDIPTGHPRTVLLGCTHFPVFRRQLEEIFPATRFVDSASTTASWVAADLAQRRLLNQRDAGQVTFLATDGVERFRRVGGHFLGQEIRAVELVDL